MKKKVHWGDCLEVMPQLPDDSIDLILTDPPYYRVKNLPWDRQWNKPERFLEWVGQICKEWQRVLKPNGSLYVFASPKMAARVEAEIGKRFEVLNRIRWCKSEGWHRKAKKEEQRRFLSPWEEAVFAEQFGADSTAKGESGYAAECDKLRGFVFEPLRSYFQTELLVNASLSRKELNEALGTATNGSGMAGHYVHPGRQWKIPTARHYELLQSRCGDKHLTRPYEELRQEYEELRQEYEELRRPFFASLDAPFTDVWDFPTVKPYLGKHPCEKPLDLLSHIIRISSRPGATVLDCFAGSGSTGEAALSLGRRFIGIEKDRHWFRATRRRLSKVRGVPPPSLQTAASSSKTQYSTALYRIPRINLGLMIRHED